jgi:ribosomal protein L28
MASSHDLDMQRVAGLTGRRPLFGCATLVAHACMNVTPDL